MKFAPGVPLAIALAFDANQPRLPIGKLAMAGGQAQLEWSKDVVDSARRISPVLYPPEVGLHAARSRDFEGLHGFLADSLPEGWGRLLMRRQLAKMGMRIEELNGLERLALVGTRGRGALVFAPATTPTETVETLDLDALAAEATAILMGEEGTLAETLAGLAQGSGGARPKVHVGFGSQGQISVTDDETAPDHEAWLVKFRAPADPIDIGPIEAAYAAMAKAAGLAMSAHRLLSAKAGPAYFATRRFDRPAPGRRLHMISLCGAIEAPADRPSASYDTFMRATQAITRHADDLAACFRRMIFNVLSHNRDDHTRQHSFLMDAGGDWRLAPAYDLTFSPGPGGEHYLDIEGEGRKPTAAHVAAVGRRHGFKDRTIATTIDQVRAAVTDWPRFAKEAGVSNASRQAITSAHDAVWTTFGKLR